jgi:hypothetical protein
MDLLLEGGDAASLVLLSPLLTPVSLQGPRPLDPDPDPSFQFGLWLVTFQAHLVRLYCCSCITVIAFVERKERNIADRRNF